MVEAIIVLVILQVYGQEALIVEIIVLVVFVPTILILNLAEVAEVQVAELVVVC